MDFFHSDQFEKLANDLLSHWHIPGLSIAVIKDSEISTRAFGHAALAPEEIKATPDTLFDCASTSKSLTAAAVSVLVADNDRYPKVQWKTPVSELMPDDFVLPDAFATAHTTVEDILSHRTGMPGHDDSWMGVNAKTPDTPKSVTRNLRNLAMSKPLRTTYQYCNMMFTVATHLVEHVSNQSFDEFLRSHLLDAFDMTSTFLQPSAVFAAGQVGRFAKPYVWRDDKYEELDRFEQPEAQGAGSLQSSAADYAKWVRAMMHRQGPITEETYAELVKPRIVSNPEANEDGDLAPFFSHTLYALGWEIEFYRGHKIVRHDGLVSGFGSAMMFLPKHRFGLVIFGNADGTSDATFVLAMELIDSLLGVPQADKVDWAQHAENESQDYKEKHDKELQTLRQDSCRKESCTGSEHSPTPTLPLSTYFGTFHNDGYHFVTVTDKNGTLFIDGTDRSNACTITLEHVCDDENFIAHLVDDGGSSWPLKAQFRMKNKEVTALGIDLVDKLEDSMIWFEKQ